MKRRDQNQALKEFNLLKNLIAELDERVLEVLSRGTFTSGQRKRDKTELAPELRGTLAYADTTGDTAISEELADSVTSDVMAMVSHMTFAVNIAKHVLSITPDDVVERAKRSVPDCAACGDPVSGKIFYGRWDEKCRSRFRRWVESGNPSDEKLRFEIMVQNEKSAKEVASSE